MGIREVVLRANWPNDQIDENFCMLTRLGVLEKGAERPTLNGLMLKFVTKQDFKECESLLMTRLCAFYEKELLDNIFDVDVPLNRNDIREGLYEQVYILSR